MRTPLGAWCIQICIYFDLWKANTNIHMWLCALLPIFHVSSSTNVLTVPQTNPQCRNISPTIRHCAVHDQHNIYMHSFSHTPAESSTFAPIYKTAQNSALARIRSIKDETLLLSALVWCVLRCLGKNAFGRLAALARGDDDGKWRQSLVANHVAIFH